MSLLIWLLLAAYIDTCHSQGYGSVCSDTTFSFDCDRPYLCLNGKCDCPPQCDELDSCDSNTWECTHTCYVIIGINDGMPTLLPIEPTLSIPPSSKCTIHYLCGAVNDRYKCGKCKDVSECPGKQDRRCPEKECTKFSQWCRPCDDYSFTDCYWDVCNYKCVYSKLSPPGSVQPVQECYCKEVKECDKKKKCPKDKCGSSKKCKPCDDNDGAYEKNNICYWDDCNYKCVYDIKEGIDIVPRECYDSCPDKNDDGKEDTFLNNWLYKSSNTSSNVSIFGIMATVALLLFILIINVFVCYFCIHRQARKVNKKYDAVSTVENDENEEINNNNN